MRRAMLKELHARDVRAIVRKIITQAREGNWTAIRVLFEWVLGAPPPAVDPDRVDEHEADVRRRSPTIFERMVLGLDREDMGSPRWGPAADEPPPEPPDPRSGWELFAEERLEWGSGWAAPLDLLLLSYARWCAGYGRLLLPEGDVVQWLTGRGAVAIGVNGDRRLQGLRILD